MTGSSNRFRAACRAGFLLLMATVWTGAAFGHSASTSYVVANARGNDVNVEWSLALRDLDAAIGLDRDGDGAITWGELKAQAEKIDDYALTRLRVTSAGADCMTDDPPEHLVDEREDGAYAVLRIGFHCAIAISQLDVSYSALFEVDSRHRGLLSLDLNGATHAAVFSPDERGARFGAAPDIATLAGAYFTAGAEHLAGGADHILFLLMILAPVLLRASPEGIRNTAAARLLEVVRVLSAFTAAHAIALSLAVLQVVHAPTTVVEAGIALTIVATALDNLWPFLPGRRWMLAFAFGLIHGLGIASGLGPLHLPAAALAIALVSFNLGLEAVQVAIALGASPIGSLVRVSPAVSRRLLPVLSAGAAVVAALWFSERIGYRLTTWL